MSGMYVNQRSELRAVQPDVRRLVDLINHLLDENRILREELEVRHIYSEASRAFMSEEVRRELHERASAPSHEAVSTPQDQADSTPDRNGNAPYSASGEHWSGTATAEHSDEVVHQLEELRSEMQDLRQEVRSIQKLQSLTRASGFTPARTTSAPQLEPIQLKQPQISIASDATAGMWMKLRQPWFYVPLAWVTTLGLLAFASFILFFS